MKNMIIVGYGDRGRIYCNQALNYPDKMRIIAVVDPNPYRREEAAEKFGIPEEMRFDSVEACVKKGRIADAVINCTMDSLHVQTSVPFLKLGYDMLLEKPVTNNKKDLERLVATAKDNNAKLRICHVLRYTPFYTAIKETLMSGEIGEIVSITSTECVTICHSSHSYIRGKWNNREKCGSSMLLAKCSHDIDLICWLNNSSPPAKTESFGGRYFYIPKNAPKNSGTRCLVDCPIEKECIYSAKKLSLDHNFFQWLAWDGINKPYEDITVKEKIESLKTDNRHGVCIFKTDADIIDRQVVSIQFENGSIASHTLIAGAARGGRSIRIIGTLGEIEGFLEDNNFKVRTYNPETLLYNQRLVDVTGDVQDSDGHSGGDSRLVRDFISYISNKPGSVSTTTIEDSLYGHLIVFAADDSLDHGGELRRI